LEAPDYIVTLRPKPDATDPDGTRRLRWLLKVALRRFGLRCISVQKQEGGGDHVGSSRPDGPIEGTANSHEAQLTPFKTVEAGKNGENHEP
jgi:hypothetical protein